MTVASKNVYIDKSEKIINTIKNIIEQSKRNLLMLIQINIGH